MPALTLLVVITIILIWIFSSSLFKPIGDWFASILKDVHDALSEGEKNE